MHGEDKAEVPEAKTSVHFTVSEKNEYYYYTENTSIYIKSGENDYKTLHWGKAKCR